MSTSRIILPVLLALMLPILSHAATFAEDKTIVVSAPPPDNTYLAGVSVSVSAPLPADLAAAGGTVTTYSPIKGDALITGGTIHLQEAVEGDVRAAGLQVLIDGPVTGDVVVGGGTVKVTAPARDVRLFGLQVLATGGAEGPVTIYGTDVTLAGEYAGDVEIIASDRLIIGPDTHIRGTLRYNAPQQIEIPASSVVDGGVTYTGSYAYVPTNAEVQKFAIAGAGIFFIVRALAVMVAAGLLAGVFPIFSAPLATRVFTRRYARLSLLALLGFGVLIAAPALILLLSVSFVGAAIALLLGAAYILLVFLSYLYAGILAGGAVRYLATKRSATLISWKDAIVGMLVFFIAGSLPYVGGVITLVALCITLGALVSNLYLFAFHRTTSWHTEF
ncbi:MAG: hypothetical protein AB203_03005 [Parcubacteria bacterium C7867-008]|nr:MAG: hypothetical protein AB203_03005 [Parcubacteria bacterium C7867-008]